MSALTVYDIGDAPTFAWLVYADAAKTTPTDATVVLRVKAPDGTVTTPSVTHVGTGSYSARVTLSAAGPWSYRWEATGAVIAADEGQVQVRPSGVL
jgi:hypothetical protein